MLWLINSYRVLFLLISVCSLLLGCSQNNSTEISGYVEGDFVYISSPLTGKLEQLAVTRGQQVEAGSTLFILDLQPEAAALHQAQQQLLQTEAAAKLAYQRLERARRLYAQKHIDKDSFDAADSQFQQAQANAAAAKALTTKATWSIQQKTVSAPTSGLVYETYYQPGEVVPAGYPVVAFLPPNKINILFFAPETVLSHLHLGDRVRVACDGCQDYQATINYISPKAEYTPPVIYSRSNNYKLVYRIKASPINVPAQNLHPGQPVYITF